MFDNLNYCEFLKTCVCCSSATTTTVVVLLVVLQYTKKFVEVGSLEVSVSMDGYTPKLIYSIGHAYQV